SLIESARATQGLDLHCDVYPYEAGSTLLSQVLPPWVHEGGAGALVERLGVASIRDRVRREIETGLPGWGNHVVSAGGWHNILIARVVEPALRFAEGRSVTDLAAAADLDPLDYVADLLIRDHGGTVMIVFLMDFAVVRTALAHAQA